MRRLEATALTWADVELRDNGSALLQLRRSKTDPEDEGVVLYIGREATEALRAIRPAEQLLDLNAPVFGLSSRQVGRRVQAAAQAAGLGEGFTSHSGRVGMAQDLVKSGVELPALMTAGRWKSSKMPARYTERQAADRGAVAPVLPGRPGGLKVQEAACYVGSSPGTVEYNRFDGSMSMSSTETATEVFQKGWHKG